MNWLHTYQPAWDPIYGFADERGLAVLAHTGGEPTATPALLKL